MTAPAWSGVRLALDIIAVWVVVYPSLALSLCWTVLPAEKVAEAFDDLAADIRRQRRADWLRRCRALGRALWAVYLAVRVLLLGGAL